MTNQTQKRPKEYFLNSQTKVQIIGLASGQLSPGITPSEPQGKLPTVIASPEEVKELANTATTSMKKGKKSYDAYPIDSIVDDIKPWVHILMKDPRIGEKDFVKSLGWMKTLPDGRSSIAVYDVILPTDQMKTKITDQAMQTILNKISGKKEGNSDVRFKLVKFDPQKDFYRVRIKKIMRNLGQLSNVGNKPERVVA